MKRTSEKKIRSLFIALFIAMLIIVGLFIDHGYNFFNEFDLENPTNNMWVNGQIVATICSEVCLLIGIITVFRNRLTAFMWLYCALLVNILLTQFFLFARIEFGAIPFFLVNLFLIMITNFVIAQEKELEETSRTKRLV